MLENYARMLRVLNRHDEAEMMESRAQAIRAKHAQEIPQRYERPIPPPPHALTGVGPNSAQYLTTLLLSQGHSS